MGAHFVLEYFIRNSPKYLIGSSGWFFMIYLSPLAIAYWKLVSRYGRMETPPWLRGNYLLGGSKTLFLLSLGADILTLSIFFSDGWSTFLAEAGCSFVYFSLALWVKGIDFLLSSTLVSFTYFTSLTSLTYFTSFGGGSLTDFYVGLEVVLVDAIFCWVGSLLVF